MLALIKKVAARFCQVLAIAMVLVSATRADDAIIDLQGGLADVSQFGFLPQSQAQQALGTMQAPVLPLINQGDSSFAIISQSGANNSAQTTTIGARNLAYMRQTGSNNKAIQAIAGSGNALLLNQSGSDNAVVQAAVGNDNFQFVNVAGRGNGVAYLQAGDELAGALNVGGTNSTVVALQTPNSDRFLMPVGLTGLKDQVVIIVPGRMYVFHR